MTSYKNSMTSYIKYDYIIVKSIVLTMVCVPFPASEATLPRNIQGLTAAMENAETAANGTYVDIGNVHVHILYTCSLLAI